MLYLIVAVVLGTLGVTIGQVPEEEAFLRSGVNPEYLTQSSMAIAFIAIALLMTIGGLIDLAIKEKQAKMCSHNSVMIHNEDGETTCLRCGEENV